MNALEGLIQEQSRRRGRTKPDGFQQADYRTTTVTTGVPTD